MNRKDPMLPSPPPAEGLEPMLRSSIAPSKSSRLVCGCLGIFEGKTRPAEFRPIEMRCLSCKRWVGVIFYPSMTAYHWDGTGQDPNAPFPACFECGQQHIDDMRDRWSEYYSGLLS